MLALVVLLVLVSSSVSGSNVFVVENGMFGGSLPMKVLRNLETNEYLEVIPSLGGKTEGLRLRDRSTTLRDVLLTHRNATEAIKNQGWIGALLIPYANRIKNGSYVLNGKRYFLERNEDRGHFGKGALHGYLYKKQMQVIGTHADESEASLTLAYDFDGTDKGYPFLLHVQVRYTLSKLGLNITTTARNLMTNGQPVPFYNGWHSYFKVSDISRASIEFDRCSSWNHINVTNSSNVYSDLIPTGITSLWTRFNGSTTVGGTNEYPTYYDDEFKAIASTSRCPIIETRIRDEASGLTTILWQDDMYRFVQVYTGTKLALGEDAIALEAMSSEADSWNNGQGLRILQSGETFTGSFGVRLD
jgi:aldose 1-epimerase